MTSSLRSFIVILSSFATVCGLAMCQSTKTPLTPSAEAQRLFTDHVKPILQQHCLRCHSGANPGLMNLSSSASAFHPHPDGRGYIVPGKPDESLLIEAISRDGMHQRTMPKLLVTLTDMEIGTLREWITAGAPWPTGPAGTLSHVPSAEHP